MTFTPKDMWLHEHQEYIDAVERVIEESIALYELEEPEDHDARARQRSNFKAAIEARREVLLRLMDEHSKGGEHK
jgi:hypothetical protein